MPNTRGVQNGVRQPFIYRGIQVLPALDGGWQAFAGTHLYFEQTEDDMCVVIDSLHIVVEVYQQRDAQPVRSAKPTSAISGGGRRPSPSHGSRRYSTSHKRGAA